MRPAGFDVRHRGGWRSRLQQLEPRFGVSNVQAGSAVPRPGRTSDARRRGRFAQVFLPSQLVEISQRFQRDVEDVQVLLQADGLAAGDAGCVEAFSTRLTSDRRFRRDIAFLIGSMLGRGADERGSGELGSMEVLGVLLVAAGGTRQDFKTPSRQQLVRELLRFVGQQRRPAADGAETPGEVAVEGAAGAATRTPSPPTVRRERPSPAVPVEAVRPAPIPVPLPSLANVEVEASSRRPRAGWLVATLGVLVALGAWWVMQREGSKAKVPELASTTAPSPAPTLYPAVPPLERRVIVAHSASPGRALRKPSARVSRATGRRAEPAQASVPLTQEARVPRNAVATIAPPKVIPANVPPRAVPLPEPAENRPELKVPSTSSPVRSMRPSQSAAAAQPVDLGRERSTPGTIDVSKVFAHPEAAPTIADNDGPPPAFHPADPVLLRRNAPAAASSESGLQGSAHGGSAGPMAGNLMYSPDPEYPAEAIAAGVAGEVTVRAVVGPHGNVVDADVVSGPPLLRQAALDAVGRWRFRPYEQDGKPVTVATTAIFDFEIPQSR